MGGTGEVVERIWRSWILGFVVLFGGDVRLVCLRRRFQDLRSLWGVVPWATLPH